MEECISVFDMLKIGVGPSSSHTLGPWRAAERFLEELQSENLINKITRIKVDLYGSLSLTGKGHATDLAGMLGLSGQDPEYIPIDDIAGIVKTIEDTNEINLGNQIKIPFYSRILGTGKRGIGEGFFKSLFTKFFPIFFGKIENFGFGFEIRFCVWN